MLSVVFLFLRGLTLLLNLYYYFYLKFSLVVLKNCFWLILFQNDTQRWTTTGLGLIKDVIVTSAKTWVYFAAFRGQIIFESKFKVVLISLHFKCVPFRKPVRLSKTKGKKNTKYSTISFLNTNHKIQRISTELFRNLEFFFNFLNNFFKYDDILLTSRKYLRSWWIDWRSESLWQTDRFHSSI